MENRINFVLVIFLCATFLLGSCRNIEYSKERNTLVFKVNVESVADSMNVLNSILLSTHREYYIYAINSNYLYVVDGGQTPVKVGALSDSLLYESRFLSFLNTSDRKHFISLITFLNENYLSRCDIVDGLPFYMYRDNIYMADRQSELFRFVVLVNPEKALDLNRYKVLDMQYNLFLLSYKDENK